MLGHQHSTGQFSMRVAHIEQFPIVEEIIIKIFVLDIGI